MLGNYRVHVRSLATIRLATAEETAEFSIALYTDSTTVIAWIK